MTLKSLSTTINFPKWFAEYQRAIIKFGVNAIFIVVKPFPFDGSQAGELQTDDKSDMTVINLFDRYL